MRKYFIYTRHFLSDVSYLKQLLLYLFSWIVARFIPHKEVWLVCERGTDARDNGYWMFKYLQNEHPEIDSRYIITKNSEDIDKLLEYRKKVVLLNSFWFYVSVWQAKCILTAHFEDIFEFITIDSQIVREHFKTIVHSKFIIRLQHGIIMSDVPLVKRKKADLFICGSKAECDYITNIYGFKEGVVKYTGLARYDQLIDLSANKHQILIMPTWRHWLYKDGFIESSYFYTYCEFLNNKEFHYFLEANNLTAIFYIHHRFQKYSPHFKELTIPSCITVADKENYDVQTLLKESCILITDYSSVAFDFAYMGKPVIYYQFDEEDFRNKQFEKGYYDYHNGIGIWTSTLSELLNQVSLIYRKHFMLPKQIVENLNQHFVYRDTHNCERIYKEIIKAHKVVK